MKLCMIGTGYVGLVSGVCFADLGNDVICVDNNLNKINLLKKGKIPIYEPGLSELVIKNYKNKRLNFSTNLKDSVIKSDIIFICVGTPTKKNSNSADLSQVYTAAKEISKSIKKFKIIINKSTVPVTTGDEIEKIISKKVNKKFFSVVSNPEFLREGEAIRDFIYPDRVVVGSNDSKSQRILKSLYSPLISKGAKFLSTKRRAAELIKYASNAFLATKITFINEISNLFSDKTFLIMFWIHFISINLFTGGWIVKDSQKFSISKIILIIPLIVTYLIGPLGLFIYWLIRIFYAKSINLYD